MLQRAKSKMSPPSNGVAAFEIETPSITATDADGQEKGKEVDANEVIDPHAADLGGDIKSAVLGKEFCWLMNEEFIVDIV